jgi:outer membrane biosynthesis protein TonB
MPAARPVAPVAPFPVARQNPVPPASTSPYEDDAAADWNPPAPEPAAFGANALAAAPLPAVPDNTVPSARRRTTSQAVPVQVPPTTDPGLILTGELLFETNPGLKPTQAPAFEAPPEQVPLTRPTHAPRLGPGRPGPVHLYLELYWGAVRRETRRFAPSKKPVHAAAEESAPMPLWGFQFPEESFTLAESVNGTWRLYVPPGSTVERSGPDGGYAPLPANALESDGSRRFLTLRGGAAARLTQRQMSLVAYAAPLPEKVRVNPLHGLPWLALASFFFFSSALGGFLVAMPKGAETPDFAPKNLPPVALRLIAPEPKKKEEAKKKLEAIKQKAAKKPVADKPTKTPPQPQPEKPQPTKAPTAAESPALKALAKLTAAGPATKDLLAAVDKLGSGPGSKNVKNSNFKLSGLIGKAPIANAGLGTFGLGGGGKGGGSTLGAEILRGKGGGGIGALGAGGVGKGQVGGTVTRATARAIAAQGSIDREAVARVVNSHLQEVHACYERALLKDPGLAGKVVLEWTISTDGRVVAAKTKSSSLRNASVEACILSNLKTWTFPPAKGGVVIITYPFLFNSVGY